MKPKSLAGLLCACLAFATFLTPKQASAQAQKDPWASGADIPWGSAGVNGPGTSIKVLLSKENGMVDNTIRALYLVKVDPGGTYTIAAAPNEDRLFFVTVGQGRFTLGDEPVDARPGDAFGVPAGVKHGLTNAGKDPIELMVLASPLQAPNPSAKPRWLRTDDQAWTLNKTHGPGCEEKNGLRGGFSAVISGLWLMRVPPHGINYAHTGNFDHQLFYIWAAAVPNPTPRDSRTYGTRWLTGATLLQAKVGDAFYAHGGPTPVLHGTYNESPDTPMIYVAFGVSIPGARPARRSGGGVQPGAGRAQPPGR